MTTAFGAGSAPLAAPLVHRSGTPGTGPIDFYLPGLKPYRTQELQQSTPNAWLPISLTGSGCALACEHCRAQVLRPMLSAPARGGLFDLCRALAERGTRGVLISGGSDSRGEVPLQVHAKEIARVRAELGLRVVVHTGLASAETAGALADAGVEGAMIDLIGADATLREIYHLPDRTVHDVEASLAALQQAGLRVIPHIVLGLHYGRFLGEEEALQMAVRQGVDTLVVVVFTALPGTPMAGIPSPPTAAIARFLENARRALPKSRLLLGCARPMGHEKVAIDRAAIDAGVDGIAYPAEGIVGYARSQGRSPRVFEYCCSLTWEP